MRRALAGVAAAVTLGATYVVGSPVTAGATQQSTNSAGATGYVVLYAEGANPAAARAAIAVVGGTLVKENTKVGYPLVRSADATFRDRVASQPALDGARNRPIGFAPKASRPSREAVERLTSERATAATKATPARLAPAQGAEPLADLQWGTCGRSVRRRTVPTGCSGAVAASWSASSTPVSTPSTPTSGRTSTGT